MSDDVSKLTLFPLPPLQQMLVAVVMAGVLARIIKSYSDIIGHSGTPTVDDLQARLTADIKNNEIGGVSMADDASMTTQVLVLTDYAFTLARSDSP